MIYFAGYKNGDDLFKREEIEVGTDQVIWSTDIGREIAPGRPQDAHFRGNIVQAMVAYAKGSSATQLVPLQDVTRIIAIGSDRMMAAVQGGAPRRAGAVPRRDHVGIGSINSPMQCMMKEVCAQCLQRHVDPATGKEEFIFSCFNQDQELDRVDFPNLNARLRQNTVQEKLSNLWFDHLLGDGGSSARLGVTFARHSSRLRPPLPGDLDRLSGADGTGSFPSAVGAPELSPLLAVGAILIGLSRSARPTRQPAGRRYFCGHGCPVGAPGAPMYRTRRKFDAATADSPGGRGCRPSRCRFRSPEASCLPSPAGESADGRPVSTGLRPAVPVVIQIYGGAWQNGQPGDNTRFATQLAQHGYLVAAIDYRHAPQWRWPAQIDDVRAGLEWIIAHAGEYTAEIRSTWRWWADPPAPSWR